MQHNRKSHEERIVALISFFLHENPGSGRTQIVKFLYLTDLEYRHYQGKPVTDLEYIWGDFGPFDQRIYDALENMKAQGLVTEEPYTSNYGEPAYRYEFNGALKGDVLHPAELAIAEEVAKQVRDTPLRTLLDDVVYQTLPMIDAKKRQARGEKLRMDQVNFAKQKFGIDLEEAWEADEGLKSGQGIPAQQFFKEVIEHCSH